MQLTLLQPKVELHESQAKIKKEVYREIREGRKRVLVVAPCAWGKTIFASSIIADAISRGKKCLFIIHLDCLIEQTINALKLFNIDAGVIAGKYKENREAMVQIGSCQALMARTKKDLDTWWYPDVTIIDECHDASLWSTWSQKKFPKLYEGELQDHLIKKQFAPTMLQKELAFFGITDPNPMWSDVKSAHRKLLKELHPDKHDLSDHKEIYTAKTSELNAQWEIIRKYEKLFPSTKNAKVINEIVPYGSIMIGLTGSPFRNKSRESMSDFFEVQVCAPTPGEMVQIGRLSPCVYFSIPEKIETKGVKNDTNGDYKSSQLAMNAIPVVRDLCSNYLRIARDRTFICFACNVQHAEIIFREFEAENIKIKIVTGDTLVSLRKDYYQALANKEIDGIVSVGCITTGFDVKNIGCILMARPTKSFSLYIQMLGRGGRIAEDKEDCYVLDQTDNVRKMGFIEELTYPELGADKNDRPIEKKVCPQCHRMVNIGVRKCLCGYIFEDIPEREARVPKEKTIMPLGDMEIIIPKQSKRIFSYYRKRIKFHFLKNNNPGRAYYETIEKFREVELNIPVYIPKEWAKNAIYDHPSVEAKTSYLLWLNNFAQVNQKDQSWVMMMFSLEFGSISQRS